MDSGLLARWAALSILLGALCVGVPRNAGPDEPAHAVRAAGLVRGQVLGSPTDDGAVYRAFDVPAWAGQPDPTCFAMDPNRAAGCSTVVPTAGDAELVSSAASYPVLAHLVPGLATLLPGGARTLYLARLFGAFVAAGVLAAAFGRVRRRGPTAVFTTLLAVTPAAIFTLVVINPSGAAVVGAVAVTVALRDLAAGDAAAGRLCCVGVGCLALTRPDGWFWVAALVVLAAFAWTPAAMRSAWATLSRRSRAVIALSLAIAVGWAVAVRPQLIPVPTDLRGADLVAAVLARTATNVDGAIGLFGWLDTSVPTLVSYAWWVLLGIAVTLAWIRGANRSVAAAVAGLGAFVIEGWLADLTSAGSVGLVWQGRYALPLLIGAVIALGPPAHRVADAAVPSAIEAAIELHSRRMAFAVGLVWIAGYWQAMRRWSVGDNGSPFPWDWQVGASAVHPAIVVAVFAAATLWFVQLVLPAAVDAGDASGAVATHEPDDPAVVRSDSVTPS